MAYRTSLPDARERFVAEILAVVREVGGGDERGNRAIGDLLVRVMRSHDAIYIADQDRFDLECAKFAVTALCMIVAA